MNTDLRPGAGSWRARGSRIAIGFALSAICALRQQPREHEREKLVGVYFIASLALRNLKTWLFFAAGIVYSNGPRVD